jgi:hypothetical protein
MHDIESLYGTAAAAIRCADSQQVLQRTKAVVPSQGCAPPGVGWVSWQCAAVQGHPQCGAAGGNSTSQLSNRNQRRTSSCSSTSNLQTDTARHSKQQVLIYFNSKLQRVPS